jgi:predicted glycosyltransferase
MDNDPHRVKRILVYTHNSIGLGHAYRTLALVTGIRRSRPDIDFLILSGSSIPTIFLSQGIEVIKLPSIRLEMEGKDASMTPRYFQGVDLETLLDLRQRLILDAFDFFRPDVLMIEHHMIGQANELMPLVVRKLVRRPRGSDFALVYVCRGIMKGFTGFQVPLPNPRHGLVSMDMGSLLDFIYVLEDRAVVDVNTAYMGGDQALEKKIRYLGKITNKTHEELPSREQALHRLGLPERPIILISLGRNRRVYPISSRLFEVFLSLDIHSRYQVVLVLDPYMERDMARRLRNHPLGKAVRFYPFLPDLVDLIAHSDLVVSRAGYNTINEILMTGVKALIIPEGHGHGEQEERARRLAREPMVLLQEDEFFTTDLESVLTDLLQRPSRRTPVRFDKYAIGEVIIRDLELWRHERMH